MTSRVRSFRLCMALLLAACIALLAPAASAGPRARPKLPDDFTVVSDDGVRVALPKSVEFRAPEIKNETTALRRRLNAAWGVPVLGNVDALIVRSHEQMREQSPEGLVPPDYASGVAYLGENVLLVSLVEPRTFEATKVNEVYRHELVHIALKDAIGENRVPRWFHEGVAIFEARENESERRDALRTGVVTRRFSSLYELDKHFGEESSDVNLAYAEAADFVRYLRRDEDQQRFVLLLERLRGGQNFYGALADAYGKPVPELEYQWREDLKTRFPLWSALLSSSLLWVGTVVLLAIGLVLRRRRNKKILKKWELEEEQMALASEAESPAEFAAPLRASGQMKIEHEGSYHTLH